MNESPFSDLEYAGAHAAASRNVPRAVSGIAEPSLFVRSRHPTRHCSPALLALLLRRAEALRPRLTTGLPCRWSQRAKLLLDLCEFNPTKNGVLDYEERRRCGTRHNDRLMTAARPCERARSVIFSRRRRLSA